MIEYVVERNWRSEFMNNIEIFINTYEKLNPENQNYMLGILQTLKHAQDILTKQQCVALTSKDETTLK